MTDQDQYMDTKKTHGGEDSSSSSESESEGISVKEKVYRLFGRERPVHNVFGGGKHADLFLWRNKKISGGVLGGATAVWVLFELLEYHLLPLVCHILILGVATAFLYSSATTFIKKTPPQIPVVQIPEKPFLDFFSDLRTAINYGISVFREIASGRDLKKFLAVIAGLWFVSTVGSCFNFLTLIYILFVLLHTVPVLYEKYDDKIDPLAEKASIEINKYYAILDAKVLSKIPRGPLRDNKRD